jgi:hypothetical protein
MTIRTDDRRLISAEMLFMNRTARYKLSDREKKTNKKWKEHADRTTKKVLKYEPKEKQCLGGLLKL